MATYNIEMYNNASYDMTFKYKDPAGAAINLTGATIKMQIKSAKRGSKAYWTGVSGDGLTITPAEGRIDVYVDHASIKEFPFTQGAYDILITWPSGRKEVLIAGKVIVHYGITS